MKKKIYFISGHRDITEKEFKEWYVPRLVEAAAENSEFVVAECIGVDRLAQDWLRDNLKNHSRVTVYHMLEKPRYLASMLFKTAGGYQDDVQRDSAMTTISTEDIAFIRKGRWTSGTAQNILRRYEKTN